MSTRNAVQIVVRECVECGEVSTGGYHDDATCRGPILYIDGEWVCGRCGIPITVSTTCDVCGGQEEMKRGDVTLDTRPSHHPRAIEQRVHELTNQARSDRGVSTLSYNHRLAAVAHRYSRELAYRDFFAHESPDGSSLVDRYRRLGVNSGRGGENIAQRSTDHRASAREIARRIVDGWLESAGHRENVLRAAFDVEGIGVTYGPDGCVYAVQNFG